jgi:hypothetical protein
LHADAEKGALPSSIKPNQAVILVAELHGIRDQIDDHLRQTVGVRTDGRKILSNVCLKGDVARLTEQASRGRQRVLDHRLRREFCHLPIGLARLHLGKIEHIVDQSSESLALLNDDLQEFVTLPYFEVGVVAHDLAEGTD